MAKYIVYSYEKSGCQSVEDANVHAVVDGFESAKLEALSELEQLASHGHRHVRLEGERFQCFEALRFPNGCIQSGTLQSIDGQPVQYQ